MTAARILYFDLETAPNLGYAWGQYEQNLLDRVHEWYVLCLSWQWHGESKIHDFSQIEADIDFVNEPWNDVPVIEKLWQLLDEADIAIAHNGDKFDIRKSNTRFAIHDMGPPSPFRSIDTKKVAQRYFAFPSNRLDDLGQSLGLSRKVKHDGLDMWWGCMQGDPSWWKKMIRYNRQDIRLLRQVYYRLRPFISNHPNMANYEGFCSTCGAGPEHAHSRGPVQKMQTTTYMQYHCQVCGGYFRARKIGSGHTPPPTTSVTRR